MSEKQGPAANAGEAEAISQILRAVRALRYGSVEIIVHDGRIVQIERREKLRLDSRTTGGD